MTTSLQWTSYDGVRSIGFPNFVENFHKRVVNHECDCHIQTHTTHAWQRSLVEPATQNQTIEEQHQKEKDSRFGPLIPGNLNSTIDSVLVLV
jgi:hypothetical protein